MTAIGQELRQGRYNSQQDGGMVLPGLPGPEGQWQGPAWQGGPAAAPLLPLSLSNGSLSGLDAMGASGLSGGLPPLPGLSLPLPPLPQPGAAPLPALASGVSGSEPAYASTFGPATGSLSGHAAAQAPLTGKPGRSVEGVTSGIDCAAFITSCGSRVAASGALTERLAILSCAGSKRDYAAMLHGGSALSASVASGTAQQVRPAAS